MLTNEWEARCGLIVTDWSLVSPGHDSWHWTWTWSAGPHHSNILSSSLIDRAKNTEIELALIYFCFFLHPGHPGQYPDHIMKPRYNYPRAQDTGSALYPASQLCSIICSVGSSGPVLGSGAARGNVGCDTLLCHWGNIIATLLRAFVHPAIVRASGSI